MANVHETRTTRSIGNNTDLAPMTSHPERILRSSNPSFQTAFPNPNMGRDVDDQVETLEQALESDDDGPISPSPFEQVPYISISLSVFDLLASTELRAAM